MCARVCALVCAGVCVCVCGCEDALESLGFRAHHARWSYEDCSVPVCEDNCPLLSLGVRV